MIAKAVTFFFGVLTLGFLVRAVQYGYKWLTHAPSQDLNYKALTLWSLVYVVVCAAVTFAVSKLSRNEQVGEG